MGFASKRAFVRFGNDVEQDQRLQAISGGIVSADRGRDKRLGQLAARPCAALGAAQTTGVFGLAAGGRQSPFVDGCRWPLSGVFRRTWRVEFFIGTCPYRRRLGCAARRHGARYSNAGRSGRRCSDARVQAGRTGHAGSNSGIIPRSFGWVESATLQLGIYLHTGNRLRGAGGSGQPPRRTETG